MNYQQHYDRLISRSSAHILTGYCERHHVVPRCIGGENSAKNIVKLTAEEHYVAHLLLVKIYPHVRGLIWAAIRQAKNAKNHRAYAWLKERHADAMSEQHSGKTLSAEHKEKLHLARRGTKNSPQHNERIAASARGRVCSDEIRAKISASRAGQKPSPETRAKLSAALIGNQNRRGIPHTEETKQRIKATLLRRFA